MKIQNDTDRTRELLMRIREELFEYVYIYNRAMMQLNRMAYWKGIDATVVKAEAMDSMYKLRKLSIKVEKLLNEAVRVNNRYTRIIDSNIANVHSIDV